MDQAKMMISDGLASRSAYNSCKVNVQFQQQAQVYDRRII